MSKTTFTPTGGEWYYLEGSVRATYEGQGGFEGLQIADCSQNMVALSADGSEEESNGLLMAAAPDLLLALEMIVKNAQPQQAKTKEGLTITYDLDGAWYDKARAAIAKAKGEA